MGSAAIMPSEYMVCPRPPPRERAHGGDDVSLRARTSWSPTTAPQHRLCASEQHHRRFAGSEERVQATRGEATDCQRAGA